MIGIQFGFLSTNQCGGSTTMMTVGNIERWHLGKFGRNRGNVIIISDYPKLMSESVDRRDEIILWCLGSIFHNQLVKNGIVRISKEYRFDIGIVYANVLHAIFFLIATS